MERRPLRGGTALSCPGAGIFGAVVALRGIRDRHVTAGREPLTRPCGIPRPHPPHR